MTASIDIPTAEKVARLLEAKEAAEHDLTVAIEQHNLAARLLAQNLRRENGLYVATERQVATFHARRAERKAAEDRADAAHDAWEQAR